MRLISGFVDTLTRLTVDILVWLFQNMGMTIALAKDVEDFLQEQVRAGVCADASQLANDAIRAVREQQRRSFAVTPELEAWLLEAADKPVAPLSGLDFDHIREKVRARIRSSPA
jgi:Arc/MetJ-type ribon-helix-helix transcriptional regulator